MDQGKIGTKRRFEEVFFAVHANLAFALFDHRANPRWRQEATKAVAAGPNPLDEGALRDKFDAISPAIICR